MEIIHLSDLHFGTEENARLWSSQLVQDVRREMNLSTIDALILSGDIANKATEAEYKAAKVFLDELKEEFNLQPNQIIIVPGNHDIDRKPVDKAYENDYQGELKEGFDQGYYIKQIKNLNEYYLTNEYKKEINKIIKSKPKQSDKDKEKEDKYDYFLVRHEETYKQRFKNFSDFYQYIKGKPYPLEDQEKGILNYFPEQKLLIVGFNSAWKINHRHPEHLTDANINNDAITKVLNEIDQRYQDWVKIAVWHHPLHSPFEDRIKDDSFMQRLSQSGFCFVIHGHIHKADESPYHRPYEGKIRFIPAGTFGAPVWQLVPGYPLQYNRLKLTRDKLTIYTRRREELNGAWKADARWNTQGGKFSDSYIYELSQHLRFERSSISKPLVLPQPLEVYVERPPLEQKCYEAIETPGGLICIKAPQKMGTGKLIGKIRHKAESNNYRIVQLDFWEWESEDEDEDTYSKFIFWFCQRISNDLNLSITESMQADMKGNAYCYDYFSNYILPQIKIDSALVLILSSVDRLFPYDFAKKFFGLLRSWYNYGKSLEKWQKLRLILTYNTEVYVKIDAAMSPFNVGEKIELLEFNIGQIKDFATQYNLNLNDRQVENLMSYIGGHPYLVDKAVKEITRLESSFNSEGDFVKKAISRESLEKIFEYPLKDLWNQLHGSTEQSRKIMIQIIKKILDDIEEETIEIKNIDNDLKKALFLLESLGLIVKNDDQVKFRNNLYREYFRKKF